MFDPGAKFRPLFRRRAHRLMGKVRRYITISEHDAACFQGRDDGLLTFEAVAGIEQGSEVRVDGVKRAEISVQELSDHFAEPRAILREPGGKHLMPSRLEFVRQQAHLRLLAAAVYSFDGDEFAAMCHQYSAEHK